MSRAPHPSLGFVLALTASSLLAQPLAALVSFWASGYWPLAAGIVIGGQMATFVLQIVAGCAIAWRWRLWWIPFIACLLAALAWTVGAPLTIVNDRTTVFGMWADMVETLGPLALVLASAVFVTPASTRRADASLILIVLGISTLVGVGVYNIDTARAIVAGVTDLEAVVEVSIRSAVLGAIAVLEIRAGVLVRSAPVARARRALLVYVIASIVAHIALSVLAIILILVHDIYREHLAEFRTQQIGFQVIFAVSSLVTPLLIWSYVRRELRADHVATKRELPSALAWMALVYATFSLARSLLLGKDATDGELGSFDVAIGLLFGVDGLLLAFAGAAALGRRAWATWVALVAALVAAGTAVTMLVYIHTEERMFMTPRELGPLLIMVPASAILAWGNRKMVRERVTLGTVFE